MEVALLHATIKSFPSHKFRAPRKSNTEMNLKQNWMNQKRLSHIPLSQTAPLFKSDYLHTTCET